METYNLFIASSGAAKHIAHELWPKLVSAADTSQLTLHVERWWETTFTPGVSTLQDLIKQCNNVHFAIVLLTRDDFGKKKGQGAFMPRDNCIYEAGLFTGSFGPDPKRCFLLTSCEEKALPTDLLGLTTIRIPEVPPGTMSDDHQQKLSIVANDIVKTIKNMKLKPRGVVPLTSGGELIKWERLEKDGGRLKANSQVMVNAEQPMELNDPESAVRVQQNMRGHIRYLYFFHADVASTNVIAELIWSLAIVGTKAASGNTLAEAEKPKVLANLKTIANHLCIYLLRYKPLLQMCIHNAERANDATSYLRYAREKNPFFIEWFETGEAKRYADSLRRLCKESEVIGKHDSVFRATTEFNYAEEPKYKNALTAEFQKLFPDFLWKDVTKYCFGDD